MLRVLASSWPLLLGVMLLMVGNGVQGSLLGIRGSIEGFSVAQLSVVMSGYFVGFLFGSQVAPRMIRRVGHVRTFSALGSLISAVLVVYPVVPDWVAWTALRVLIGFCFSGIYITAESWLNNMATNETRGQALSAYMIVQMIGIIASQALLNVADPSGFTLFVIPSVLVSLAFLPVLLAAVPAPTFTETRPLSFRALFRISPLGCMGMLLTGGIFAAMFGMSSVWGSMAGLSVRQISLFVGGIYVGGLLLQYPIGWASDRIDRRRLILGLSALGGVAMLVPAAIDLPFGAVLAAGVLLGGVTNPLYSLLIAYTNDFLGKEDMAAASAGLIFLNGLGAVFGPLATGWIMQRAGPGGFFLVMAVLFLGLAAYAGWRMTRRAAPAGTGSYSTLAPTASALAVGAVFEKDGTPRKDTAMATPVEVLDFWLREIGPDGWYKGGDAIDASVRDRYADLWQAAHGGGLEHWAEGTAGTLAYLIVTDQFPRNIHRGTALAFATDALALAAARRAVEAGWDMGAPEPERQFFYMPFEHSEDLADQDLAVRLMAERMPSDPEMLLHARAHREMIATFGRFPTRNAALGRESTAAEAAFLAGGGYAALVERLRAG